jgi:hypothetical protein
MGPALSPVATSRQRRPNLLRLLGDAALRNRFGAYNRSAVERRFTRQRMESDLQRMASDLAAVRPTRSCCHTLRFNIALAEQEICRRVMRKGQQHRYRRHPN